MNCLYLGTDEHHLKKTTVSVACSRNGQSSYMVKRVLRLILEFLMNNKLSQKRAKWEMQRCFWVLVIQSS